MVLGLLIIIIAVCVRARCCRCRFWCCVVLFRFSFYFSYHHLLLAVARCTDCAGGSLICSLHILRASSFIGSYSSYTWPLGAHRHFILPLRPELQHTLSSLLHLLIIIIIASNNFLTNRSVLSAFRTAATFSPSIFTSCFFLPHIGFAVGFSAGRASFYVRPKFVSALGWEIIACLFGKIYSFGIVSFHFTFIRFVEFWTESVLLFFFYLFTFGKK